MNTEITGETSESETKVNIVTGGHRHIIHNFSAANKETKKSLGSSTFKIANHKWQIVCYPGGETEDVSEYVSLFLGYRGNENDCQATWRLTLVNQLNKENNRTRAWLKADKFNKFQNGRRWGWQKFIKREDLLNPDLGFILNDTIIFEASLDMFIDQKTHMKKKPQKVVLANLYPIPETNLNDAFSSMFVEVNGKNFTPGQTGVYSNNASSTLADVCFNVQGSVIRAHSQILAAQSQVMATMFGGSFRERGSNPENKIINVPVDDVDATVFYHLVKYFYTGEVDFLSLRTPNNQVKTFSGSNKRSPVNDAMEDVVSKRMLKSSGEVMNNSLDACSEVSLTQNYELKDERESRDIVWNDQTRTAYQMNNILSLFEAADRYGMNKLRLECEHAILELLCESLTSKNPTYEAFSQVLTAVDRHNSTQLKKLCFSILTSRKIKHEVKKGIITSHNFEKMDSKLATEFLVYFAKHTNLTSSEQDRHHRPFSCVRHNVPSNSHMRLLRDTPTDVQLQDANMATEEAEYENDSDDYDDIQSDGAVYLGSVSGEQALPGSVDASAMRDAEVVQELSERGYPVTGSRVELVRRLLEARDYEDEVRETSDALKANGSIEKNDLVVSVRKGRQFVAALTNSAEGEHEEEGVGSSGSTKRRMRFNTTDLHI